MGEFTRRRRRRRRRRRQGRSRWRDDADTGAWRLPAAHQTSDPTPRHNLQNDATTVTSGGGEDQPFPPLLATLHAHPVQACEALYLRFLPPLPANARAPTSARTKAEATAANTRRIRMKTPVSQSLPAATLLVANKIVFMSCPWLVSKPVRRTTHGHPLSGGGGSPARSDPLADPAPFFARALSVALPPMPLVALSSACWSTCWLVGEAPGCEPSGL